MIARTSTKEFQKTMNNIIEYSLGFLDGIQKGRLEFFNNLGKQTIHALYQYIDVHAKQSPQTLHHVYEWYREGSPGARLYSFNHNATTNGVSIKSSFKQSQSIPNGSSEPFIKKASVMEKGAAVKISPKKSNVLVFEIDGEKIFTSKTVTVRNPGGVGVQGSFEKIFDEFMLRYFKQSFLKASGLYDYLSKPTIYKQNIKSGSKTGKAKGVQTGYSWITNARIGVE